jgi:hypothetical protein
LSYFPLQWLAVGSQSTAFYGETKVTEPFTTLVLFPFYVFLGPVITEEGTLLITTGLNSYRVIAKGQKIGFSQN